MSAPARLMDHFADVQRSTGCTEPAAVALAAALARQAAGGAPRRITVRCDPGTHRNGLRAGVPGAEGRCGLDLAAALGALAGDPDGRLDVLAGVEPADVSAALALIEGRAVTVLEQPRAGLAIDVAVETEVGHGEAWLRGDHTRVVSLLRDGVPVPLPAWACERAAPPPPPTSLAAALALADALTHDDERQLVTGLEVNLAAALLAGGVRAEARGLHAGPVRAEAQDASALAQETSALAEEASALAEAASHARMRGQQLTLMTSGWSGNQGLVATLPIHVIAARVFASRGAIARALATSHLVGKLLREGAPSPLCHALVAASAGAAAGCVRLLGGDAAAVERACHLVVASAGAPACDGAKPACSLRVGLAAAQAVRCARRAIDGPHDDVTGGLVGATLEETARLLAGAAARLRDGGLPCGA